MATKLEQLLAMHKPEALAAGMVYEVWSDGEITLTKGGGLYGARTLHCVESGRGEARFPAEAFPKNVWNNAFGRIAVGSNDEAQAARALILAGE
jgi:hypothetical protein